MVWIFREINLVQLKEFKEDCLLSSALTLLNQKSVLPGIMHGVICGLVSISLDKHINTDFGY